MNKIIPLLQEMISYYTGDPKRIQHFIKVHSFACLIGAAEHLSEPELFTLETASIVHDIGIKEAERKYGKCTGKLQEQEGPALACEMLHNLGFEDKLIERVCYLVGHHHTYNNIDGRDYQILVEADFLVNLYEDHSSKDTAQNVCNNIFKTETGRQICIDMFSL